jgi:ABC-2 type transport system permease protein
MFTTFTILVRGTFRDRISLFWAIIFPIVFLLVLGFIFPTTAYRQQLLAGMLAVSVLFFGLTGIAFEALFQRSSGVYKLLRATPYHTLSFVANLTAARGLVALLSCVIVVITAIIALNIHLSALSLLLLLPILALGALCFTFLGLVISNLSDNVNQVSLFNNIVTLPMIFASETFYSLSTTPTWLKILSRLLPLSYVLDAEHAALAGNVTGTLVPTLILLGFTLLSLTLSVITFRWDPAVSLIRSLRMSTEKR